MRDPQPTSDTEWQPPTPEPNLLPDGRVNMHVYGLLNPGEPGFDQQRDVEWRTGSDAPCYPEEFPDAK